MNITQERPNTVNRSNPHLYLPSTDPRHEYENIGPGTPVLQSPSFSFLPPKPAFLQQVPTTSETEQQQHQSLTLSPCITENTINYIVLDLDNSASQEAKQTSPTLKKSQEEPANTGTQANDPGSCIFYYLRRCTWRRRVCHNRFRQNRCSHQVCQPEVIQ